MDVGGLLNGSLLRVVLYLLVFWPTVGYYVYHDTRRRGSSRPRAKAISYGFFGIVGAIVYEMRTDAENS